jgi:histidinol-phosphate aminotransferase
VNLIKMASNENPYGPSPRAVAAMRAVLAECNVYPDNDATELKQKLAKLHQLQPEQIVVAAGLTALLETIALTLLSPGLNAVTSERSFIIYPIATRAAGGQLIKVPMHDNSFDLDAIAAAIDRDTRIVFLANPNNPPGSMVLVHDVDRFLQKIPAHVMVVLDEAYYDFAQYFAGLRSVDYSNSLDYVRQNRNVVVLRTFSKAHGLAGVRVGYGLGSAEFISSLAHMRTIFSISVLAQAAAMAAIEDEAHIRKSLENNGAQAEVLVQAISDLGYRVAPTWANFLYCELREDAASVARRMQSEGVAILPLGTWGAPTAIRVTIGKPEQNEIFVNAFRKVMVHAILR